MPSTSAGAVDLSGIRGYLFDLDGVLTPTAVVHMHAWSRLFTPFLEQHGAAPYTDDDYFAYIDGKPRYDGVRSLLQSRGIRVPEGDVTDAPTADTVHGLGNRKNDAFNATLAEEGVTAYPASVAFLDTVQAAGCHVAVVSSSKNAPAVLEAAGLADRFEVVVDGAVAVRDGLPGKPEPDTFERAAELLGLPTTACAVVEDAESGVKAGAAGEFGIVIGVDRGVGRAALEELGADAIVDELDELIPFVVTGFQTAPSSPPQPTDQTAPSSPPQPTDQTAPSSPPQPTDQTAPSSPPQPTDTNTNTREEPA